MVCFDVSDEHRLRRVANELENFGQRVQRSVFECWLDDKQPLPAMESERGGR
jgi:CRISPR-associated protein Cas2